MSINKKKLLKILLGIEKNAQKLKIFGAKPSKCLLAISGGQDSMCLAVFLRSFQRKFHIEFDIVYCHHAWHPDNFFNVVQITKYAAYTETGCFVFLNPKF